MIDLWFVFFIDYCTVYDPNSPGIHKGMLNPLYCILILTDSRTETKRLNRLKPRFSYFKNVSLLTMLTIILPKLQQNPVTLL
jgi:hypothetical protein